MHMNKNILLQIIGVSVLLALAIYWFVSSQNSMSSTPTAPSTNTPVAPTPVAGLKIETLTEGTGPGAVSGQTVSVDYTGMFTDGKVFDSSIPRGAPFTVHLGKGEVIKGWDLGIVGMKVGEKRRLTIAPELAYGAGGFAGAIPPNSTLIFDVTLKTLK